MTQNIQSRKTEDKYWFSRHFFPFRIKNLLLLAFVWLMVGFTTGTGTLMGPVRWVTSLVRSRGWSSETESFLVIILIVFFVVGSLLISLGMVRVVLRSKHIHVKFGVPALAALAAMGALYFWMNPQKFKVPTSVEEISVPGSQFTFGAYPTLEKFEELKKRGFTAVVSLLHPAVAPFEPKLIADEKKAAEKAEMKLIHIPMLPWVSGNEKAVERIKELVREGEGKYYIHCYLGKDRVNFVRRIIENTQEDVEIKREAPKAGPRRIEDFPRFERGKRTIVDENIFITPYPTEEEFLAFVLTGRIENVVSLLNIKNTDDKPWIEKERKLLKKYQLPFHLFPLTTYPFDPEKALDIARIIRNLDRPVLVHGFLTPSVRSQAMVQALRSDLPPLPPVQFKTPLKQGPVEILAPNIAVGPRPTGPEFGGTLHQRGVRIFAYLGDSGNPEAQEDSQLLKQAGMEWRVFPPYSENSLWEAVGNGGPWYLYGPNLGGVREELKTRFGPAIPDKIRPGLTKTDSVPRNDEKEPAALTSVPESKISLKDGVVPYLLDFAKQAVPEWEQIIILGPLFLLYAGLGGAFAGYLRTVKNVKAPYTRKVFHFTIFTMAGILHLSAGLPAVVLFGVIVSACVLYAMWRGAGFPFYEAMARPTDAPHRSFFILVPLVTTALGGGISVLLFPHFAYAGFFVGGWGDAVGEPVGTKWGKHRYKVPSLLGVKVTRSLEGSSAVVFFGSLIAFAAFSAAGYPVIQALYASLICGFAGAAVEAFSAHGLDNLTIQVAASATAFFILG